MIPRILLLCLAARISCGLPQGSLDDLISDVFGEDPANQPQVNPNPLPPVTPNPLPPVAPNPVDPIPDINNPGPGRIPGTRQTVEEGEDCSCVPYYLCPNGTILTDGTGLLDIRAKPGACENYMDICCKEPLDPNQPLKPQPIPRKGCGQRHPEGVGFRITGGKDNEAQFGEFPWMTALLKKTVLSDGSDLMVYACGGALIHEKVVLTAAHCVAPSNDNTEVIARVGEWDTQTNNEIYRHQNAKVSKVLIHPGFTRSNLHNDYALLILENPVTLGENIDTVCLPRQGFVPLSRECYATGWGKDKFDNSGSVSKNVWRTKRHLGLLPNLSRDIHSFLEDLHTKHQEIRNQWSNFKKQRVQERPWSRKTALNAPGEKGQYQVILKKIDLPIVPKDQCLDLLRRTRLGPFFKLHDSFVCAGGIIGKDTCKGDGGSPLVCPMQGKPPGTYEVTGLVAWGIGCGDETPGVYAGVAYARQWIDQELSKHGIQLE